MPIRTALRALRRSPWFTATAIATIALGIGANLTVFSLVNRVLLAPLPYRDADRLVWIATWHSEQGRYSKSAGFDLDAWRQQTALFEAVEVYWDRSFTVTGTDRPEGIVGQQFSPGHFTMLGAPAALGRTLLESDADPGRSDVVVLSDAFWRRRFAARPDAVGQPLELDGRRYHVVGVMPPAFAHPNALTDVWVPVALSRRELDDRKQRPYRVVARLRDGVTLARAENALRALGARHGREFADTHAGFSVSMRPVRDIYVGDVSTLLWIVQGTAAILLIIASANVASLVLVRASGRQRETAVRVALGAGRGDLLRHHFTEGLTLAGAGGALGILIAAWGTRVLPDLLASARGVTLTTATESWIDWRVLLAAALATLAAAVMFGVTPLLRGRDALSLTLKTGMKGATADRRTRAIRQAIVAGQIALSVMLLVGAGLLIRSFVSLQSRGFGFTPDDVTTAQIVLPRDRYATTAQSGEFLRQLVAEASALPGVQAAAAINTLPLTGFNALRPHFLPGRQPAQDRFAEFRIVTPDYFRTMTIPLRRGRVFDDNDRPGAQDVVIVNDTLAQRLWPGADPIGQVLMVPDFGTPAARVVVGVVGDTRHHDLTKDPEPEIYRPAYQTYWPFFGVVVRTASAADTIERPLREAAARVDRSVPIASVRALSALADKSLAWRRSSMALLTVFALAAGFLAFVGVYSVMAYSVAARAKEFGVRVALGAAPSTVAAAIVAQGTRLAAVGIVAGLAAAAATGRLIGTLLFAVRPIDPLTFAVVALITGAAAVLATTMPALTAMRVDPSAALRADE
jgi:putative ABC transport system permease protein